MSEQVLTPIRILVADDHPVVREGLAAILSTQADFAVLGEASNGQEVVDKVKTLRPAVVLLDLEMPGMDGVEALQRLKLSQPSPAVIVFTAFDTDERILGALKAGAKGYLLKGAPREEIFRSIRVVSQGGSLLEPVVASRLLHHLSMNSRSQSFETEIRPKVRLTAREQEVLSLLARGMTNKEIADQLVVSERTAKFHVSSIMHKLGAGNRTEAVLLAAQDSLIEL